MTEKERKLVVSLIQEACEEYDITFEPSYSGRGMFGSRCCGFITSDPTNDIMTIAEYVKESCGLSLPKSSMDSMGFDKIVYFESLPEKEEELEEEPEEKEKEKESIKKQKLTKKSTKQVQEEDVPQR